MAENIMEYVLNLSGNLMEKLKDYLNVLTALNGLSFVYFTSDKSQIIELCEWLDNNEGKVRNIFKGVSLSTVKSPTSGSNSYTDIMLYKLNAV